jgi:glycosyltransferase involved in cell wall biosynthesis
MRNSPPKLLYFATEDWFVCSHWLPQIAGAKEAGFDVVVVTRTNKHADKIREHGARVIHFEISRRGTNVLRELGTVLRLIRIYRAERPDIAHHVAMKPMLYGSLAAHLTRVPRAVNWVAGMGWLFISKSRRARLMQVVVRKIFGVLLRGTEIIVENKDDRAIIAGLGIAESHIHLVRGAGVDTAVYAPVPEPEGVPIVVLPARMLWDKGVREFVEAAALLRQRGVSARFVLVGDPDGENPASVPEAQLADWQRQGVVECWGRREDIPQVLARSNIVCLPSYREGLPKSLLEAASSGRAIVTTDVPGCREVVRDGDNGILVEARNSKALADGLQRLLVDPVLRQRMGQRGRERVMSEFSQEIVVSRVMSVYRGASSE